MGVVFFALRSKATVIPCAIEENDKPLFKRLKGTYGKPVNIDSLRKQKASAQEAADTIMQEIGKLIHHS